MGRFNDVDWARLSEIGEAFGVITAVISAVALVAVAFSLRIQRRQARVAQLEAVLAVRIQLLQYAIKKPRYLKIWGFDLPSEPSRESAYVSMVFAYLKMAFSLDLLTELELRRYCELVFSQPVVARFWISAREVYLNDLSTPKGQLFAKIMDRQFERSRSTVPVESGRHRHRRSRLWATAGLALGVGVAGAMVLRRRTRRT